MMSYTQTTYINLTLMRIPNGVHLLCGFTIYRLYNQRLNTVPVYSVFIMSIVVFNVTVFCFKILYLKNSG